MSHRRWGAAAAALLLALTALAGCGGSGTEKHGTDWAAAPRKGGGLTTLAQSDAGGFRLYTRSGTKSFLPGVNLGSTTPLHQPGEVGTIPGSDYRRWFAQMGSLGIRVVRIYTLPAPAFYDELARYNAAHPTAPLYLFQGVYLPDESYTEPGRTLFTRSVDDAFTRELVDVSQAVHGHLTRAPRPGRAGGHYTTDVSRWLAGWVVGVEWDGQAVRRTDRLQRDAAYRPGTYFAATSDASATERWLARHLDTLAASEHGYGTSEPIAFVNWPTADPLHHPLEPNRDEDLAGIDANHVLPTGAWPGGTFASYHAYPYYPDFQRYEPALQQTRWRGRPDPYAGYVAALRRHYAAHMPLLVTEFGVPSSLGSAHQGPLGRDQGAHTEQEAMQTDADLLRMLQAQGVGGAFVFAWSDEWFKRTWNTLAHVDLERLALWHDPLTNEQWFGLLATDSRPVPDAAVEAEPAGGPFRYLYAWADASYLHLEVTARGPVPDRLSVAAKVLRGPQPADYRVDLDRTTGTGLASVRKALDPVRLDSGARPYRPGEADAWHPFWLLVDRATTVAGTTHPAEFDRVGELVQGSWDPRDARYDSLSTWDVDAAHRTIRLRIPWSMLGMADPSAHLALGEGNPAPRVRVPSIGLDVTAADGSAHLDFGWPSWTYVRSTERLKAGSSVLARAYADLAP